MQSISTWSFEPWIIGRGIHWTCTEHMLACAWASLESQSQYWTRPRVYTDTLGRDVLSKLWPHADYVVSYDGFFDHYSTDLFALAKIQTYTDQTQPYCHVDLDWIWHQPEPPHWRSLDLVVHGWERLDTEKYERGQNRYYNLEARRHLLRLPQILHHPEPRAVAAPNMGVVYMRNMQLNKTYTDLVWQIIKDNPQEFDRQRDLNGLHMCTLEQHVLGFVIDQDPTLACDVVFPRIPGKPRVPVNEQATHFVGEMKTDRYPGPAEYRQELLADKIESDLVQGLSRELEQERQKR